MGLKLCKDVLLTILLKLKKKKWFIHLSFVFFTLEKGSICFHLRPISCLKDQDYKFRATTNQLLPDKTGTFFGTVLCFLPSALCNQASSFLMLQFLH